MLGQPDGVPEQFMPGEVDVLMFHDHHCTPRRGSRDRDAHDSPNEKTPPVPLLGRRGEVIMKVAPLRGQCNPRSARPRDERACSENTRSRAVRAR